MYVTKDKIFIFAIFFCYLISLIMCFGSLNGKYEYKIDSNELDNCITIKSDKFDSDCSPIRIYNPNNNHVVDCDYKITVEGEILNLSNRTFNDLVLVIQLYSGYVNEYCDTTLTITISDLQLEPYQSKEFTETVRRDRGFYLMDSFEVKATINDQCFTMRDHSEFLYVSKKYYVHLAFYIIFLIVFLVISIIYLNYRKHEVKNACSEEDKNKLKRSYKVILVIFLILLCLLLMASILFSESAKRGVLYIIASIFLLCGMIPIGRQKSFFKFLIDSLSDMSKWATKGQWGAKRGRKKKKWWT